MGKQRNYVQIGRVVVVNYGADTDKLAVVLDVVDQSRALVDGPAVQRQTIPFRRLTLTNIVLDVPRGVRHGTLLKALAKQKTQEKFNATALGKKISERVIRANSTDFDRFKLMLLRKQKSLIVKSELSKLKKSGSKVRGPKPVSKKEE